MRLRIPGRQSDPASQLSIQADLEGVLARAGQGNVEHQHRTCFDVDHPGGWLPKLNGALAAEQLAATLIHETNPDGVNSDFRSPSANPEDEVGAGVDRGEIRQPDVLEHAQHTELALLVDQGVVGHYGKVEMQVSGPEWM